jgi:hypothetical protein
MACWALAVDTSQRTAGRGEDEDDDDDEEEEACCLLCISSSYKPFSSSTRSKARTPVGERTTFRTFVVTALSR